MGKVGGKVEKSKENVGKSKENVGKSNRPMGLLLLPTFYLLLFTFWGIKLRRITLYPKDNVRAIIFSFFIMLFQNPNRLSLFELPVSAS